MTDTETTKTTDTQLGGLHHITAVTGNAAGNVAFYTDTLGMRLVKKTVNQDDVTAYHLFYGDELGHPGTELTFFDWPDAGPARHGAGTIAAILLRAPGAKCLLPRTISLPPRPKERSPHSVARGHHTGPSPVHSLGCPANVRESMSPSIAFTYPLGCHTRAQPQSVRG